MNRAMDWFKQAENDLLFEYFTQEQAAEAVEYAERFIVAIGKEIHAASENHG